MALSTAVLNADMIKSAYLSRSLVDVNPTSLSVWSNFYLMWLVYEFLCGVASTEIPMGR